MKNTRELIPFLRKSQDPSKREDPTGEVGSAPRSEKFARLCETVLKKTQRVYLLVYRRYKKYHLLKEVIKEKNSLKL